jgi:hypothetical protein
MAMRLRSARTRRRSRGCSATPHRRREGHMAHRIDPRASRHAPTPRPAQVRSGAPTCAVSPPVSFHRQAGRRWRAGAALAGHARPRCVRAGSHESELCDEAVTTCGRMPTLPPEGVLGHGLLAASFVVVLSVLSWAPLDVSANAAGPISQSSALGGRADRGRDHPAGLDRQVLPVHGPRPPSAARSNRLPRPWRHPPRDGR